MNDKKSATQNFPKKQSPYAMFATDTDMEATGITVDFGEFQFLIARAGGGNQKYGAMMEQKMRPHKRLFDKNLLGEEKAMEIAVDVFAKTVVLGWTNVVDREGKPLTYSVVNCKKLLTDLPELFRELQAEAMNSANFRALDAEEIAKNS